MVEEGEGFAGSSAAQAELDVAESLRADGLVTVAEACSGEDGGGAHGKSCALLWIYLSCHLVFGIVYIVFIGLCAFLCVNSIKLKLKRHVQRESRRDDVTAFHMFIQTITTIHVHHRHAYVIAYLSFDRTESRRF